MFFWMWLSKEHHIFPHPPPCFRQPSPNASRLGWLRIRSPHCIISLSGIAIWLPRMPPLTGTCFISGSRHWTIGFSSVPEAWGFSISRIPWWRRPENPRDAVGSSLAMNRTSWEVLFQRFRRPVFWRSSMLGMESRHQLGLAASCPPRLGLHVSRTPGRGAASRK